MSIVIFADKTMCAQIDELTNSQLSTLISSPINIHLHKTVQQRNTDILNTKKK